MEGRPGILIAIEGIDGAGKTTQAEMLRQTLDTHFDVVASKEPTDGPWGRKLRESAQTGRLSLDEETNAFLRDREQHVAELISPALEAGKIMLLDRYFYSTIAYQGARGRSVQELDDISREMAPIPDKVLLLDIDPEVALARIVEGRQETPNEFERADYLGAVRAIFNTLADQHAEIARIDATQSIADMGRHIQELIIDGPVKDRLSEADQGGLLGAASLREQGDWSTIRERLLG